MARQTLILVAALIGTPFLAGAQAQTKDNPVCSALVEVANDLYLVDATGKSLTQFTSDGSPKDSPSLAPDGSKVAFIPSTLPNTFTVADASGRSNSYPAVIPGHDDDSGNSTSSSNSPTAPLIGVDWAAEDVVRLDKHIGKDTDRFEFYKLPETNFSSPRRAARSALAGGVAAPIQGVPGVQVKVTSIVGGVTLYVTLPTGNWIQSRVNPGDFLTVKLEHQTLGLFPTIAGGVVKVAVLSSTPGPDAFNSPLAWWLRDRDDDDRSLVIVTNSATGPMLTVLRAEDDHRTRVLAQAPLSLQGSVNVMRFVTPSLLYLETFSTFGIVPVQITRVGPSQELQIGPIATLVRNLTVNTTRTPVTVPVITWACK